ncbi:hypothetical protein UlMin_045036 [Ulmus minor]
MDKIDTEASLREREDESASTGSQTTHLGLKEGVPNRSLQRLPAPLVANESDVCGRDEDKERIIEVLLSDDDTGKNLSVIAIVGLGGVGKTTLITKVIFEKVISEKYKLSELQSELNKAEKYFELQSELNKAEKYELFELQSALDKAISGKKLFFVLDDVWNEDYLRWDNLKSAFKSGAPGSKIIVTTRSKDVASIMGKVTMHELKLVSDEDCWGIFKKHVFDDNEAPAELKEIGREFVKRCKGLPLAVKSLAGLLRSKSNPEEWREVLNSDIWQLEYHNKVLPALWLSYHFLPPCLKRCFAYCSIFPKDYQFGESDMKKIIWLWMAEGLLQPETGKKIEEVGEKYLQTLIARSFFQYSSQDESTMEKPKFVMHDIVHDLAMCISSEFSFELGDFDDMHDLTTKARHLSYRKGSEVSTKMKGLTSRTRSLQTLLALPLSVPPLFLRPLKYDKPVLEKSFLNELFLKAGGCLRVLSLSESSTTELPESIGNMKYLRYLDLSLTEVKEIPDSICTLYNLQTLLLSECRQLAHLPTRLAALDHLRHLDIRGTPLKEMPHQMCKMKSLRRLSDFVLGKNDGRRIKELGKLRLLEGSLCISGLQNIVDVKDVLGAKLKKKKFLSELILKWDDDNDIDSRKEREVLEALQPHRDLKKLEIRGYRGTRFPDWWSFSRGRVGQEGMVFPCLKELILMSCDKLIVGFPDCYLPPSLKYIFIHVCKEMVDVCPKFNIYPSPNSQNSPILSGTVILLFSVVMILFNFSNKHKIVNLNSFFFFLSVSNIILFLKNQSSREEQKKEWPNIQPKAFFSLHFMSFCKGTSGIETWENWPWESAKSVCSKLVAGRGAISFQPRLNSFCSACLRFPIPLRSSVRSSLSALLTAQVQFH